MSSDYQWVVAPGLRCDPLSKGIDAATRQHLPAQKNSARERLYVVYRPHTRSSPILVNAATMYLLESFRTPSTVYEVLASRIRGRSARAIRSVSEARQAVEQLVDAAALVRVSTRREHDLRAVTPRLPDGSRFRHYRILECSHYTSDTEIYKVEELARKTRFAVKIMRPSSRVSDGATFKAILQREFSTLRRLEGSAACSLRETGLYRGRPYGVLEWIDGVPVAEAAERLREETTSAGRRELLELAIACLGAFETLHRGGYVHGDIHPGNVIIDRAGRPRLIDLGLAQRLRGKSRIGLAGLLGGVIPFLPPERARAILSGRKTIEIGISDEVYALGALLYYLFTGSYPLDLSPICETALRETIDKPARAFDAVGAAAWPPLEAILARALSKKPSDRFDSLERFSTALKSCFAPTTSKPSPQAIAKLSDERFVEQKAVEYLDEIRNSSFSSLEASQEPPHASLAFGGAGVAYALLHASQSLDDPDLLALANQWIGWSRAASKKRAAFSSPTIGLAATATLPGSLYYGAAGIHYVAALIAGAMDDVSGMDRALNDLSSLTATRRMPLELMFGVAGQLLGTVHLTGELRQPRAGNDARRLAHVLLERPWTSIRDYGMAHGVAGLQYSLLEWSRVSGETLPERFWTTLHELRRRGEWSTKSARWPVGPNAKSQTYMCSWCNGAPGLALLWSKAYELRGDAAFLKSARGCGHEILRNADGVSHLCCGLAGSAYALLALSQVDPGKAWKSIGTQYAVKAMRDERLELWDRSLFKGRAGLLCLALDLCGTGAARFPCVEVN